MNIEGKIAVVTGGAMGNGLGIVTSFLKAKATVIILDYSDQLKDTIATLKEEYQSVSGYIVDIENKREVEQVVSDIGKNFLGIDILVNNAGVCRLAPFMEMSDEIRDFHFNINICGTWNVTKAIIPLMKKRGGGKIINLSSVTGLMVADTGEVAYATTKAALMGFTKALAMELVADHILVNAILPGYILTPMVSKIATETNASNPDSVIDGIAKGIPMGRLGTIEELGNLALFLASDLCSYITGQGIVIDGGSTLPETNSVGV